MTITIPIELIGLAVILTPFVPVAFVTHKAWTRRLENDDTLVQPGRQQNGIKPRASQPKPQGPPPSAKPRRERHGD